MTENVTETSKNEKPTETSFDSSTTDSPSLTIASVNGIKRKEAGEAVLASLTVIAKSADGFYGFDKTGTIFVYTGKDTDIADLQKGDEVLVRGYASVYNFSHQISSFTDANEVLHPVEIEIKEKSIVSIDYTTKSINGILDTDNEDVDFYGQAVSVRGHVEYSGVYQAPYALTLNRKDKVYLSRSMISSIDFSSLQGEYIELYGYVYCYLSNGFVLTPETYLPLTSEKVTDEEAVSAAIYRLQGFDGKTTADDFALPKTDFGASISYVSDHPDILDIDGHYTSPSIATDVTFTASVTRGTLSKSVSFTITALSKSDAKVVISESFTAGGNKSAAYSCDFVELYNQTEEPIDLSTYSLQNASTGKTSKFTVHKLSGIIEPHDYFLIRGKVKEVEGQSPIKDYDFALDSFDPGATNYILALAKDQSQITFTNDGTESALTSNNVVDLLGVGSSSLYEGAKACSISDNAKSLQRIDPEVDTDNNYADFFVAIPTPRKSGAK